MFGIGWGTKNLRKGVMIKFREASRAFENLWGMDWLYSHLTPRCVKSEYNDGSRAEVITRKE